MKTSELLTANYDALIAAMKEADIEAMKKPYLKYDVSISDENEIEIDSDYPSTSYWYEGWHGVVSFYYNNCSILEWDEREIIEIYEEDLFPRLNPEDQTAIKTYIDNLFEEDDSYYSDYYYSKAIQYIGENYEYAWEAYKDDLIKAVFDNNSEDYYTDKLNHRIEELHFIEQYIPYNA